MIEPQTLSEKINKMDFVYGCEKNFDEFASRLNEKDRIAIVSHNDLDGLVSALVAKNAIVPSHLKFAQYKHHFVSDVMKKSREEQLNKVIFLDMNMDDVESDLKSLEDIAEILIIDHHKAKYDLNSKKTIFFLSDKGFSAAHTAYNLFNKIKTFDQDFIVACALISDHQYDKPMALDFIKKIESKYNFRKSEKVWESELGKLSSVLINSALFFGDREEECFKLLEQIKVPWDIATMKRYSDEVDYEVKRMEEDFRENRKTYSWGYIHNLESRFNLTSSMSTRLSDDTPNKLLIFYSKLDNLIKISARRADSGYDCNNLLKEATKDIPNCTKGGHVPAAGATFKSEYFEQFKKNLLNILGKN